MNKETLIALIEKDIDELKTLTRGFSQMDRFPQPLLDLAVAKADNLRGYLSQLPCASSAEPTISEPIAAEPDQEYAAPVAQPHEEAPVVPAETASLPVAADEKNEPESSESETEKAVGAAPTDEPHPTVAETLVKKETVVDEFGKKDDESLAHAIASKPVADLKQAISIADRFRFQRELFANNGEAMIRALDALNACVAYEEAEKLLTDRLNLPHDNPAAADFAELVKRRFGL